METMTIQRRTISIDGNAKSTLKWRVKKSRLPRKLKKKLKKLGTYHVGHGFLMCDSTAFYPELEKIADEKK